MVKFAGDFKTLTVLEVGGLVLLGYFAYRMLKFLLSWLSNNVLCNCVHKRILKPGPNEYAVITGSTDGIGLEYARQLAEKGYSLVLLSRTEEKLRRVASEIHEQYPQCKKIETIAVDFSRTDIYDRIKQKLQSLDGPIHVLVNNVGTVHAYPEYFANYPEGYNLRLINVNIVSVTAMSEIVLKIWTAQKSNPGAKGPKGVLINISSTAGSFELPLNSSYSASKVYMNYLSKILSIEYTKDNILVQNVAPGMVDTPLSSKMRDESQIVSPKDFVQYALKTVGTERYTNAHPKHKLFNGAGLFLKAVLYEPLFDKAILYFMKNVRAKYDKSQKQIFKNKIRIKIYLKRDETHFDDLKFC